MKRLILLTTLLFTAHAGFAQEEPAAVPSGNFYQTIMIAVLLVFMLLLLWVAIILLKAVRAMEIATFHPEIMVQEPQEAPMEYHDWLALRKARPSVWNKFLGLKPLADETAMQADDDYDGIVELNNPTPAWFMGLFYGTIVFAAGYLLIYHVFSWGKLQDQEYADEMAKAKTEQAAFLASAANAVDESSVRVSADAGEIAEGKAVFATNCVPCHGDHAQGVVGPNLTDAYWLHGGAVNSIFKTIKYGIPEKGMISWEKKLTPKQIAGVANYILSLKGTNPVNAKAPQGEKE
ncbi:cbb3-type cytochrome c oxidase N-terminal domain-containing protein [Hufsiella ginkgonis]|uniref:C-type cytochrome n=1 Tax=Hufsiella ginkgonis TaxID=2695274 RepID=A0A7K1Y236_9SPHI|nr:cbb3-type cytochrome c oxidase N-terminal domain-containing protein [Hufsiella ginkgonis]MXV16746.1 c-type cytochrome [Hufsiella ginkgonis]